MYRVKVWTASTGKADPIEHENVIAYSAKDGVFSVCHFDGSETFYASSVWREVDIEPIKED